MNNRIATLSAFAAAFLAPAAALATTDAALAASEATRGANDATFAIAMCLGVALAATGGAIGQGRAASAALDGICRNPGSADKVFTPLLLSLAFVESLVIFTLVVALIVSGKMNGITMSELGL